MIAIFNYSPANPFFYAFYFFPRYLSRQDLAISGIIRILDILLTKTNK